MPQKIYGNIDQLSQTKGNNVMQSLNGSQKKRNNPVGQSTKPSSREKHNKLPILPDIRKDKSAYVIIMAFRLQPSCDLKQQLLT
jgi:hypothetical protein